MKTVAQKLGMKEGRSALVVNAPDGYTEFSGDTPIEEADIIQFFTQSKETLQNFLEENREKLKEGVLLWVTYPKASPHLGINRDIIAEFVKNYALTPNAICSIDETWSALRMRKS